MPHDITGKELNEISVKNVGTFTRNPNYKDLPNYNRLRITNSNKLMATSILDFNTYPDSGKSA